MELNTVLAAVGAKPPGHCYPSFPSEPGLLFSELPQTLFPLSKNKQKVHVFALGTCQITSEITESQSGRGWKGPLGII